LSAFRAVRLASLLFAAAFLAAASAFAQSAPPAQPGRELRIDITRGKVEPLPIAITNFTGQQPNEQQVGRDVAQVVSADLVRSGLYLTIDQRA
jgi:TolB protein